MVSRRQTVNQFGKRQQRLSDETIDYFIGGEALSGIRRKSAKTTRPEPSFSDLPPDKYDISPVSATRIERENYLRTLDRRIIWQSDFNDNSLSQINSGGNAAICATYSFDGIRSVRLAPPGGGTASITAYNFLPRSRRGAFEFHFLPVAATNVSRFDFYMNLKCSEERSMVAYDLRYTPATGVWSHSMDAGATQITLSPVIATNALQWYRVRVAFDVSKKPWVIESLNINSTTFKQYPLEITPLANVSTNDFAQFVLQTVSTGGGVCNWNVDRLLYTDEGDSD